MKIEYNQHIGIYNEAFDEEYCQGLIDLFENTQEKFDRTASGQQDFVTDLSMMLDNDIPEHQPYFKEFAKVFNEAYTHYQKEFKFPKVVCNPEFKIQKTQPGEGYHLFHSEYPDRLTMPQTNNVYKTEEGINVTDYHRIAAWTLYLNDIDEGGETEFLYQSVRVAPKQGNFCIFPASYTHLHRGNPPLNGTKYIATGWIFLQPINIDKL